MPWDALYVWGVLRLRRRGERWPLPRVAAFVLLGLSGLVMATMSALAVYDHVLFWPAAVQNVLLDLVAPLGLALGDPLRLTLETLPEDAARWARAVMTGRVVRLLTFPLVSTVSPLSARSGADHRADGLLHPILRHRPARRLAVTS